MASRLMLSLKKASTEPDIWTLSTMGEFRMGRSPTQATTIHFASHGSDTSGEISETLPSQNEEDVELDYVPQLPRDRGSRQSC